MNKIDKKQKKRVIILINIVVVIVLSLIVCLVNKQKYIAGNATVSYLEENQELIIPVTEPQEQVQVKEQIKDTNNSNMNVVETETLIDYTSNEDPVEYVKANQEEMVDGIILKIDDNELYVKDEQIIEETKDKLTNILITDPEVRENYEITGELNNYVKDNKTITSIYLENDISYEEGLVVKSQMINTSEELMYRLFHKDKDYEQKTYYIVEENQTFDQVKEATKLNDIQFFINNSMYKGTPLLKTGDQIIVDKIDPIISVAVYYEYSKEKELKYDTIKEETDDLDEGETEVKQKGQNGKSLVTYRAKYVNGEVIEEVQIDSKELQKIINKIVLVGTHEEESYEYSSGDTTSSANSNVGGFIWPIASRNVVCGFGCYSGHVGIDIQGGYGASIYAAKSGTVATAGYSAYGGGYEVTINHGGGVYTIYSHMKQQPNVSAGQYVSQGQVIGYEGATGNVTGPHLHFEIRLGCSSGAFSGSPVNALYYLS